jgi:hypothetical protein
MSDTTNNFESHMSDYMKIIVTNLGISGFLISIILLFTIYIIYLISKLVYGYFEKFYKKHTQFLAAKGQWATSVKNDSTDNEVYINVVEEEANDKYYTNTTYDSIEKEIQGILDTYALEKDEYSKRLQEYKEKTGHDIPEDKVDRTSLMKEYDNW